MNTIIEKYADTFKLKKIVNKEQIRFYNDQELVSKIDKNNFKILSYKSMGKWKKCRTSEMIHMILNKIPAHE
jgi:hypothetical protein